MRILFINTGPWGTGSFTVVRGLSKELLKLGHRVKIFFPDSNLASSDREEYYSNEELYKIWRFPLKTSQSGIHTFPLMISDPHPRNPNAITFKELSDEQISFYENEFREELSSVIDSFKPDIIECHHIWYPSWILHQMGLDYIVTAHHSDQLGFLFDKRVQPKAIAGARGAKKIIAISDSVKKEVETLYGVDESEVVVVENGYDRDVFYEKREDKAAVLRKFNISAGDNDLIISFAGKLSQTKGFDILLQANKLLEPGLSIQIIVMGAGELVDICRDMDKNSFSLKNVHIVGHLAPEMVAELHNISLLSVMPSRSEGFGVSCLEAMACGLPMVVTRCGGPEQFAVGKIIDKGSPQQLADAIMTILKLPSPEYQKLRQEALRVAGNFSSAAITQKHLQIYQSIKR
ncbi:MAG: glycosyltransferase family 4 protein [Legionella sp.]|nr:glycosyltransferase family 4 protein [Legionella sp.]